MIYFGENQLGHSSFGIISWKKVLNKGLTDRLDISLFLITGFISPMILRKVLIQLTVLDTQHWTEFYAVDFRFQVLHSEFLLVELSRAEFRIVFKI